MGTPSAEAILEIMQAKQQKMLDLINISKQGYPCMFYIRINF